jgi:hypothetical protein
MTRGDPDLPQHSSCDRCAEFRPILKRRVCDPDPRREFAQLRRGQCRAVHEPDKVREGIHGSFLAPCRRPSRIETPLMVG